MLRKCVGKERRSGRRERMKEEGLKDRNRFLYISACVQKCSSTGCSVYSSLPFLSLTCYQIYIERLQCTRWRENISTRLVHVVSIPSITTQGQLILLWSLFPSIIWPTKYPLRTVNFVRKSEGHRLGKWTLMSLTVPPRWYRATFHSMSH